MRNICNRFSYSTIANGHGIVTRPGNHEGDKLTFKTISNGAGTYPVLSSNGFNDGASPSRIDAFCWYLAGNFGTFMTNQTTFAQRAAL